MANNTGSWASGALMRFGSLDFIVTIGGGLERIQAPTHSDGINAVTHALRDLRLRRQGDASASHQRSGFDIACLERQLQTFLGPRSIRDDFRCTVYTLANVAAPLAGGYPIPPNVMADHAVATFLPGPGNAARRTRHHMAHHVITHPGGTEIVGMAEFTSASDVDLLETDSSLGSNSDSSCGNHHPSRECFMAGTPEGHVGDLEDSPSHSRDCTPPPNSTLVRVSGRPAQPPPAPDAFAGR